MLHYLIYLLLIFMLMIIIHIIINYKLDSKSNKVVKTTSTYSPPIFKPSLDQINNSKYPTIKYKWGGCMALKPQTTKVDPNAYCNRDCRLLKKFKNKKIWEKGKYIL